MWHMCGVLLADTDFIELYSIICLSLKATIPKRWTEFGKLAKFVGQTAVDAVYGMEKRSFEPALGVLKEFEGLMPDRLCGIVLYMFGNESTILGIKCDFKIPQTEQLWSWHVLHPYATAEGFFHRSRGTLLCCYFGLMLFFTCVFPLVVKAEINFVHPVLGCTHTALSLCIM